MAIATSNWPRLIFPGLNTIYGNSLKDHPTKYTDQFEVRMSNQAVEEILGVTGFGLAAVKTEGNSILYDDDSQGYLARFAHLTYALGFIITREMFEDDLYNIVGARRSKKLARSINQTMEIVHANIFNRGFNSSYTGADGKELFATDHPFYNGGTYANELSVAADLSEASLEQAHKDIWRWEDDRGLLINAQLQSIHIPPELEFEIERIMSSPYRVGTSDNDVNALYTLGKLPGGVKINPYFTNAKAWFIKTDVPDGTISFLKRKMEFDVDNDFDTENAKYKASVRFSCGWGDPRQWFGSPGVS